MGRSPASVLDALVCPDDTAAYLAMTVPGPDAAGPLSALDPERLTHAGRVDALVAIERQMAWLAGMQQRVLASMSADDAARSDAATKSDAAARSGDRWVREDVACALRLAPPTAQRRLAVAETLAGRLPATLALLESGVISYLHAMNLAEAVYSLDAKATAKVEDRVLARAAEQTLSEFKRSVRRAVASAAPARAELHRDEAMAERRVCVTPHDDGMAELWALLPAEGAAALSAAVDALASATPADDPRSADQRRADALVDLGVAALHDPLLPKAHGMRPAVQVTVALSTLLGLDEQPGELAGHGPIPAALARRIAADPTGTWRRLVTDPATGALLDYGATTYRPPSNLTAFVIARDQTCTFPGCRRAAHRCDIDHEVPASRGGATSADNLAALCRRHHRAKHQAGWQVRRGLRTGVSQWSSPAGHTYRSRPPSYPRDQSADDDPEPPPF